MPDPSVTLVRRFRAPPEAVFDACTDPRKLRLWFGPADFRVTDLTAEPRPGGRLWFTMTGPEGAVAAEGTFREVEPPRRVRLTWRWLGDDGAPDGGDSLLTFDIAPDGEGSRLTLTHEDLPDEEAAQSHESGWSQAVDKLERLLE